MDNNSIFAHKQKTRNERDRSRTIGRPLCSLSVGEPGDPGCGWNTEGGRQKRFQCWHCSSIVRFDVRLNWERRKILTFSAELVYHHLQWVTWRGSAAIKALLFRLMRWLRFTYILHCYSLNSFELILLLLDPFSCPGPLAPCIHLIFTVTMWRVTFFYTL